VFTVTDSTSVGFIADILALSPVTNENKRGSDIRLVALKSQHKGTSAPSLVTLVVDAGMMRRGSPLVAAVTALSFIQCLDCS